MNGKVDWDTFAYKFRDNPQDIFELLAYHMFCREFGINDGLQADYDHPYLESSPAKLADGTVVGFQAKYFKDSCVSSKYKPKLLKELRGAKEKYPELSKLQFYLSRPLSHSSKKNKTKTDWQKEIDQEARRLGIEVQWIVPSNFQIILNKDEMRDLWKYFFTISSQNDITHEDKYDTVPNLDKNQYITTNDFNKYYKYKKDSNLYWIDNDGMKYRADYLPLQGICNTDADNDSPSEFMDLLDIVLNPSKYLIENNAATTQFVVIYGPSHSGLSFLCETAMQSFINDRAISEFDNIAYFRLTEEDIKENVLYERLKIEGKSVFSKGFNNGLLIIDGLGRMIDNDGYNVSMISALRESIKALTRTEFVLRVVITVRVNIEYDPIAKWDGEEDTIYIQNRMINLDDSNMLYTLFSGLRGIRLSTEENKKRIEKLLLDLYTSPECKAILTHPEWYKCFELKPQTILGSIRNGTVFTKCQIVYNILHNRLIGTESWETIDNQCVKIASGIYAKGKWNYLDVNTIEEYAKNPLLIIEDCKIGFRSSVVLDYYIAQYLYSLFQDINISRPKSIVTFLAALSKVELVDGEYNKDIQSIGINVDVSTNHDLILYFFKDRCEDESVSTNKQRTKAIFSYLLEGSINCDGSTASMFYAVNEKDLAVLHNTRLVSIHSIIERVIRNLIKLLRVYLEMGTENMVAFKDFIRTHSFSNIKLPNTIYAEKSLEHANFKQSVFKDFKIGIVDNSDNETKVLHSDFGESYLQHLSIHNTDVEFCDFSNVSIDEVRIQGSVFRHCSFENAEMLNACFEKSKFYHTSFNGLKIDTSAFDDSSYIDGKSVKDISFEEWEKIGVKPVGGQRKVEIVYYNKNED